MPEQNILSELASFADVGEHSKFKLLQNWQEYSYYRKVRYSTKVLIKFLQDSANKQFKSYCEDVICGTTDVYKLLACKYLIKILNCYLEELRIIEDMLDEYKTYLLAGNWLDFVFNNQRPLDKLFDHRGL